MNLREQELIERAMIERLENHSQGLGAQGSAWPYKVNVRRLLLRQDLPVCSGALDCIVVATAKCRSGAHDVCHNHGDTCFECTGNTASNNTV
jgi:hypothetical protein